MGILTPDAFAEYVSPAGYAIQIYTGLSRFLYRVSRAAHTRMRFITPGGPPEETTVTVEETVEIMSSIFFNFMVLNKIAGPSDYSISQEQINHASTLTTHAEDFVVAHEIGHILLWIARGGEPGDLSPEEEFEADTHALIIALGGRADPAAMKDISQRMAYAGAEFAVRVYASLQHLGYQFRSTHPLPGLRLRKLRESATNACGGRRAFMKISTIAFSHDQLLEAMERKIAGDTAAASFIVGLTPERLLSSLSVLVEEWCKGHVQLDFAVNKIIELFSLVPDEIMRETAQQAALMYFAELPQPFNDETKQLMIREGQAYMQIASRMPEALRQVMNSEIQSAMNAMRLMAQ